MVAGHQGVTQGQTGQEGVANRENTEGSPVGEGKRGGKNKKAKDSKEKRQGGFGLNVFSSPHQTVKDERKKKG